MSFEVTTAFVDEFRATVDMLSQQVGSRFAAAVTTDNYTGDGGKAVEQIGAVTAMKKTSRHMDTPLISTPHDARWVYPTDYIWADLIDKEDKLRMIVDLESHYAINGGASINRWKDDAIIEAFFGTAQTGVRGGTSTTFPGAQQIAVALGASAATGINTTKLKRARRLLRAAEVDLDVDPIYCGISALQEEELLNEYEVKSKEFTSAPVLEDGKLRRFVGFEFIHSERLATDSNSYRRCPAWARSGMHLGMWNDLAINVSIRDDKNYSAQVHAAGTFGGTRLEEVKVTELPCSEA